MPGSVKVESVAKMKDTRRALGPVPLSDHGTLLGTLPNEYSESSFNGLTWAHAADLGRLKTSRRTLTLTFRVWEASGGIGT